jgi:hypothetical protein
MTHQAPVLRRRLDKPRDSAGQSLKAVAPDTSRFACAHGFRRFSVRAGQKLGIKEVDDGIWLASFMHYDLGYFDLEQKTVQPLDNPFGTRLSPMS